jgi:uncharacterized membrane protein
VKISQIRLLAGERICERLARVSEGELQRVIEGFNEIIG